MFFNVDSRPTRFFGVDIYWRNWGAVVMFFIVAWGISSFFDNVIFGNSAVLSIVLSGVFSLLSIVCLLAHEFGHVIVARRNGVPTNKIILMFLGAVAVMEKLPKSAWIEFKIAVVGPLVSVVLGLFFCVLAYVIAVKGGAAILPLAVFLEALGYLNIIWAIFNLLPAYPMDGGRIFKSAVYLFTRNRLLSMKIAMYVAWGIAGSMTVGFVVGYLRNPFMLIIAFLIVQSSWAEYGIIKQEEKR